MRPFGWMRDRRDSCACVAALLTAAVDATPAASSRRLAASRAACTAESASSRVIAGGEVLALPCARLLAAQLEAVDIRLRREAAGTDDQALQGLARLQLVDARRVDLALGPTRRVWRATGTRTSFWL